MPTFPPFILKSEYVDDGSAKAGFLASVDRLGPDAEARMRRHGEAMAKALEAPLSTVSFKALDLGVPELQRQADRLHGSAVAARTAANDFRLAQTAAGGLTEAAMRQAAALDAQAAQADQAAAAAKRLAASAREVESALEREASAATRSNSSLAGRRAANDNVIRSNDTMRFGLIDLGRQIGDVSTMWALGARPMQIFASQSAQMIQSVQMMTGGTSRLAMFLGGPWGIALSTAALAVTPLLGKLFETADAAGKVEFATYQLSDAQSALGTAMDLATGKIKTQSDALIGLARAQILAGQVQARADMSVARGEMGSMTQYRARVTGGMGGGLMVSRTRGDEADIISAFQDGSLNTDEAVRGLESMRRAGSITEAAFLNAAKAVTEYSIAAENLKVFQGAERMLDGRGTTADRSTFIETAKPGRQRAAQLSEDEQAFKRANEEAQRYIATLQDEIDRISLSPGQLRQLEVARARDAAATDAQRQQIDELNAAREEAISLQSREEAAAKAARAWTDFQTQTIEPLERELALLGLVGPARERAALGLEEEGFKADAAAKGIEDVNAAWREYADLRLRTIEAQSAFDQDREAAALLSDELERLIGAVSGMGGVGSVLGGLIGFTNRNIGAIDGPLGALLKTVVGTRTGDDGKVVARRLGEELYDVFGIGGPFGETLKTALEGAGIGTLAASTVLGTPNTGGQLGSAFGGAVGQDLGKSLTSGLGGTLGMLGGPLGSIAGGLIGGLAGSIIEKVLVGVPKGSATITSATGGIAGTTGGGSSRDNAIGLAGSVQDALRKIAEQFDAQLGSFAVSIGQRDGDYRVDPYGRGQTRLTDKGVKDFGQDQAAAIRFAIMDAIADGAIRGIDDATMRLIKSGNDLEAALQDALDFRGVLDRISAREDPVDAEIDKLNSEFERYQDLYTRAGATASQWVDLEAEYWATRDEVIRDATERSLGSLKGFLNDLTIGNDALSLTDRRSSALAAYTPLAAKVAAGDTGAFDEFTEAAKALLDIQRQMSGSQSGYFDLYNEIRSLTESAYDKAGAGNAALLERDSPFGARPLLVDNTNVVSAIDTLTRRMEENGRAQVEALRAANENFGTLIALQRAAVVGGDSRFQFSEGNW